jgi:type VI secretion system protein ImpJ
VQAERADEGLARLITRERELRDTTSDDLEPALVQVGTLRMRLLLEKDARAEYACLGAAHVVEIRADKRVVLDSSFIPPVLDCLAAPSLTGFTKEVHGLLHHRGEELASTVSGAGSAGVAGIADFLRLQVINRYEPLFAHFTALAGLHPESLLRWLLELVGELATFSAARRPGEFPAYRHDDLRATFKPVQAALHELLTMESFRPVLSIPLVEKKARIRVATIADRGLFSNAVFVLAVRSDLPTEDLRRRFPGHVKIGSVTQIAELVNRHAPGVPVAPLPVVPQGIPPHAGSVYFEFQRSGDAWKNVVDSQSIALHVGDQFPGIELELWAIRSGR